MFGWRTEIADGGGEEQVVRVRKRKREMKRVGECAYLVDKEKVPIRIAPMMRRLACFFYCTYRQHV